MLLVYEDARGTHALRRILKRSGRQHTTMELTMGDRVVGVTNPQFE